MMMEKRWHCSGVRGVCLEDRRFSRAPRVGSSDGWILSLPFWGKGWPSVYLCSGTCTIQSVDAFLVIIVSVLSYLRGCIWNLNIQRNRLCGIFSFCIKIYHCPSSILLFSKDWKRSGYISQTPLTAGFQIVNTHVRFEIGRKPQLLFCTCRNGSVLG